MFLDRDGTVIVDAGYPRDPESVELLPGAVGALSRLQQEGFALVIVSNQSGIGRGIITEAEADAVHDRMVQELATGGVRLDGAYYCPHRPEDKCPCRKPSPALLLRAASDLNLTLDRSYMIGDKPTDVETGRRAGCRTVALGAAASARPRGDVVACDWAAAIGRILALDEAR